jgi:hypothetical protein
MRCDDSTKELALLVLAEVEVVKKQEPRSQHLSSSQQVLLVSPLVCIPVSGFWHWYPGLKCGRKNPPPPNDMAFMNFHHVALRRYWHMLECPEGGYSHWDVFQDLTLTHSRPNRTSFLIGESSFVSGGYVFVIVWIVWENGSLVGLSR